MLQILTRPRYWYLGVFISLRNVAFKKDFKLGDSQIHGCPLRALCRRSRLGIKTSLGICHPSDRSNLFIKMLLIWAELQALSKCPVSLCILCIYLSLVFLILWMIKSQFLWKLISHKYLFHTTVKPDETGPWINRNTVHSDLNFKSPVFSLIIFVKNHWINWTLHIPNSDLDLRSQYTNYCYNLSP
jgi:hypothetical protein